MTLYTFRTESSCDDDRAKKLLSLLGYERIAITAPMQPTWPVTCFTFESHRSLESVRAQFWSTMARYPGRFPDLHRCAQTLAEGLHPNESWFLNEVTI